MEEEPKITPINEGEVEGHEKMFEIRFDCILKMFDFGVRTFKTGIIIREEKALAPQWFKLEHYLTLESIKHGDPYVIGMRIKELFHRLEEHIKKYEKS